MIQDLRGYNQWHPGDMMSTEAERAKALGGLKFDSDKPPLSLISREAVEQEAKALAFGAKKYATWNWAKGMKWSRLLDAALRHVYAFSDGENLDPETGLSHLAHARCCLGFLLDYIKTHPELDDRRPSNSVRDVRVENDSNEVQASVSQLSLFPELQ